MVTAASVPAGTGHIAVDAQPLRIGILGAARIAAEAIVLPARARGHEVLAVASRTRGRGAYFAQWCGIDTVYPDYPDLLADPRIELVYIALPNAVHTLWARAALRAGAHVLVEKPLTADPRRARALDRRARRAGRVLGEAHHLLAHPVYDRVRAVLGSGALGTVRRTEVELVIGAPEAGDPRWSARLGGGALNDLGCYGFALARDLHGDRAGGLAVRAARSRRSGEVDDDTTVLLTTGAGTPVRIRTAMRSDLPPVQRLTVTGARGRLELSRCLLPHLGARLTVTDAAGTRVHTAGGPSTYLHQLDELTGQIRSGRRPRWTGDDRAAAAALLGRAHRMAGTGCGIL